MTCITENKDVTSVNNFALVENASKILSMKIKNNEVKEWRHEVLQL